MEGAALTTPIPFVEPEFVKHPDGPVGLALHGLAEREAASRLAAQPIERLQRFGAVIVLLNALQECVEIEVSGCPRKTDGKAGEGHP